MAPIEIESSLTGIEEKIDDFIFSVIGLRVDEGIIGDKYEVSLGNVYPIQIGFYKSKHPEIKDFRFSCYLKMLNVFSEFMLDTQNFDQWYLLQKEYMLKIN